VSFKGAQGTFEAAILLHSDRSPLSAERAAPLRRRFAAVRARSRVVVNGDASIWRGSLPARIARRIVRPLHNSLLSRRELETERMITERIRWNPEWDRATPIPPGGSPAKTRTILTYPVRVVQESRTGTLVRPDPLDPKLDEALYES